MSFKTYSTSHVHSSTFVYILESQKSCFHSHLFTKPASTTIDFTWEFNSIWKAGSWVFLFLIFGKQHFLNFSFCSEQSFLVSYTHFSSFIDSSSISDLMFMLSIFFCHLHIQPLQYISSVLMALNASFMLIPLKLMMFRHLFYIYALYLYLLNIITEYPIVEAFQIQ